MTSLDHVTNYAGTEDFRVYVTKVCSLFAERGTKPVYEDDITHTVVRYGFMNVVQSRAGSGLHAGLCYILPRHREFISSLKYQWLPYTRGTAKSWHADGDGGGRVSGWKLDRHGMVGNADG